MSIGEWEGEYIEFLAGGRPDLSREHFLRDVNGKPLGGTPLQTRLDWLARLDAVWNAAESKPAQTQAALARGLYRMAGSADTLAERIGRQDALAVLQAAGYDPGPVARRWDDHAPPKRKPHDIYAGDPLYDDRVLAAVRAPGVSLAEVGDMAAELTAAQRREAEETAAAAPLPPGVLYETPSGHHPRESQGQGQRAHKVLRDDVPRGRPADLPASSPPWEALGAD